MGVFGRKESQPAQAAAPQELPATPGKGRPTPKRRDAEQANRHPVVSGGQAATVKPGATKEERKAAREARRVAHQSDRAKMRQALLTGDERFYPARDLGKGRRWARNYVDARHNLGEYFLFFALAFLVLSQFRNSLVNFVLAILLYLSMLGMAVDFYFLRRKIIREVTQRFGADQATGIGMYAISRALQVRRMRLPRPQVTRGQFPE